MVIKLFTLVIFQIFITSVGRAEEPTKVNQTSQMEAVQPPKLNEWFQHWRLKNKVFAENMNSKLIITRKAKGQFEVISTDSMPNRDTNHLHTLTERERDLQMNINNHHTPHPCRRTRPNILKCMSGGYLLDVSKPIWEFFSIGQTETKLIRILKAQKHPQDDYFAWLEENLGFNARVLDSDGSYVLALTPKISGRRDISGYLINNSSDKSFLKPDEAIPGPNLMLIEAKGRLAVFKIINDTAGQIDEGSIKISTKIRLASPTPKASDKVKEEQSQQESDDSKKNTD